jgi:aspartyl-tRNA(Asn)/glutamyl-tRNA(Gln) amidotransferase subunit A
VPRSPTIERVEQALHAAHSSQDSLNAFTSIDDENALKRAAELDRRIGAGDDVGPLAGTPIAVKDLIDQADQVTSSGSSFYRMRSEKTALCVAALEEAGGVVIGRTGLHEFAFGFSSENPFWGVVRNPWDPDTSPGGSSGGSAAAVAAGIVPIALGTDTGGSVRVPAALCGTYGLKVTHGRISLEGVFPLVPSIDTVGPLANSINEIEVSYRAMSGDPEPEPQRTRLRFGVPEPWFERSPTDDDIAYEFQKAIDMLASVGHVVRPVEMPDVLPSKQLWNAVAEEAREVHREFRLAGHRYGTDVKERLDAADLVSVSEIDASRIWQQTIRDGFSYIFETIDFLITPTVPVRRKVIGNDLINGQHYRSVLSYFSAIVNHSLHPAIALPLADSGTPPASLQVIGPKNSEMALIGLGRHLESKELARFILPPSSSPTPGVR